MASKKKPSDAQVQKRREQKKLSMRKARQKMIQDPIKYEEIKKRERERYHQRKASGKIKTVEQMSEREKRAARKVWKEKATKYRQERKKTVDIQQYADEITPPSSPILVRQNIPGSPQLTSGVQRGKRMVRRNRYKLKQKIQELTALNKTLNTKLEKYKKRLYRQKKNEEEAEEETPRKKIGRLMCSRSRESKDATYKKMLFGEVISKQIKDNFRQQTSPKVKRALVKVLNGKVVRKYRCLNYLSSLTSQKMFIKSQSRKTLSQRRLNLERARSDVIQFLESNKSSRLCSGKKETITRKKLKKQKRFLNDSLQNLLQAFKKEHSPPMYQKMSYQTFCRLRPFWILFPKASDRETCLCRIHENMTLLVRKLNVLNIIAEKTPSEVLKKICCDPKNEQCLEKRCTTCKTKPAVELQDINDAPVLCQKWTTRKVPLQVKGKIKMCTKTVKLEVETTKTELVNTLSKDLPQFMMHVSNIGHQYAEISKIKKYISQKNVLLHVDFSENYMCKYSTEIQSAHFGGSKPQVTIHTSVLYFHEDVAEKPLSYGTLSPCNRHDPAAIVAHLLPIFEDIKSLVPELKKIHFLSDGPCTQYKNRKMFQLLDYLSRVSGAPEIHWHFSESSHGKGAPDGVGAVLKRTADGLVAHQKDIPGCDVLIPLLQEHCKSVRVKNVEETSMTDIEKYIPKDIPPFKGTMKIHEVVFRRGFSELQVRRLTCTNCADRECSHYHLGSIPLLGTKDHPHVDARVDDTETELEENNFNAGEGPSGERVKYSEVYTSSESECDADSHECSSDEIKYNDFVIVRVFGKKSVRKYIANIIVSISREEYRVRFMARCAGTKNKFVFSEEDEANINIKDILHILTQPVMNGRLQYCFEDIPEEHSLN